MEIEYDYKKMELDVLTKCFLRKDFLPFLEHLVSRADSLGDLFSVGFIDLDRFKCMNDTYGHAFGDQALEYFSSSLRLSFEVKFESMDEQPGVFVFRYGGDEFVAVFLDVTGKQAHAMLNTALRNMRERRFLCKGKQFLMTFSAGVAAYPKDAKDVTTLLAKADKAVYFSKKHGRGRATLYSRMGLWAFKKFMVRLLFIVLLLGSMVMAFKFLASFMGRVKL